MPIVAQAPGKLVILGEYAVLHGGRALVMAVDRHCRVSIDSVDSTHCSLVTQAPNTQRFSFRLGQNSGSKLVDEIVASLSEARPVSGWEACVDSRAFFGNTGNKFGIGSSAAVLVAFAGAFGRFVGATTDELSVNALIELHRSFQGGAGSGLDVAAAKLGGITDFRLDDANRPLFGSVQLPNSVGFAGVFTGTSAATPDFLRCFDHWRASESREAESFLAEMRQTAENGYAAMSANDAGEFLRAVKAYGYQLERLGAAFGREIVTKEHRRIGELAERFDVVYKVSGAGGGDLGLALSCDTAALALFTAAVSAESFECIDLKIDRNGLVIEEQM